MDINIYAKKKSSRIKQILHETRDFSLEKNYSVGEKGRYFERGEISITFPHSIWNSI